MKVPLDALSREDRRIILVATDATYTRLTDAIDWAKVGKLLLSGAPMLGGPLLGLAGAAIGGAVVSSSYLATTWATTSVLSKLVAGDERSWLKKLTTRGEVPLPHFSPTEAANAFRFDLGGPQDGAAYVLNPCVPDHYVLPALANERLAQEKLSAFVQIAGSLGGKTLALESGVSVQPTAFLTRGRWSRTSRGHGEDEPRGLGEASRAVES